MSASGYLSPGRRPRRHIAPWILAGLMMVGGPGLAARGADMPVRAAESDSRGFEAAWRIILDRSDIPYVMIDVPHGRKRRLFVEGAIQLDCCATPEWRDTAAEKQVQLFSDSFYETVERYVFAHDKVVPLGNPETLRQLRVAVVRGFNYPFEEYFGSRVVGRDMNDVLNLVEQGRAQVGIISNVDFLYLTSSRPRNLTLGDVNYRAALRIRIHRSRPDLLAPINKAIAELKADGCLAEVIEQRLAGCTADEKER